MLSLCLPFPSPICALNITENDLNLCLFSDESKGKEFCVIIDMRGNTWSAVKPILKALDEYFTHKIHSTYIIKPDNFWQKQRTSIGSSKYKFEVFNNFFQLNID